MEETKDPFIVVRDIWKTFGKGDAAVHALSGINLDIYRKEYISIMGPSGSGKSTLFNMIGALDTPTKGTIKVGDVDLTKLSPLQLAYFRCRYIGYVFQSYNLIGHLSALDNTAIPQILLGTPRKEAEKRAAELLEFVGLHGRLTHKPLELSGGQQQRVAIARALANQPTILLADEPTANLDLKTGAGIIELFKNMTKEFGVTVISATHDHR
ncbi:MAG: ABC transporter ATP-binding protein, partial [Lentisphaeria bacterium]|nr:ABC transporter ATP-binding protein [Lentisphaeria bacterium]